MKDLMSKIKTLDYKQLALNHGEKIGIGVAGLMVVVICLFLTSWAAEYTGEPRDMEKKAEDVAERLKNNKWTEERQKEFPYLLAENELPKVIERLDPAEYEWLVDPSPKLYPRQQPAEEVEWLPLASVEVHYMQFPMGVEVPQEKPDATEEDAKSKPAKPEKAGSKKGKDSKGAEDPLMAGARPFGAMEGAGGFSSAANEKASGRRVVAVLGVIEVRRQQQALKTALHAGSLSEVRDRLNYRAFRLERQRAVPGPDPWSGPWKEVKTGESIAVLGEASDFDADLVLPKYTHVELTSPLPRRLDGDWDPNLVVHSRIPCLSEEEREMELAATTAASEALKEAGDTDEAIEGGGGFSRIQKDANRIRSRAQNNPEASGLMSDIMKKMMPGMGEMGATGARGKGMRQPPGSAMG
ncbi:MAG: hypothetical protein ACM3U2_19150, partial [Deltaproteobacteria bacterium]